MIPTISLLFCFIFLGPQKQERAMFSVYGTFPSTFLEHNFVCPSLRILYIVHISFLWIVWISFSCIVHILLVLILKGKRGTGQGGCVCVCVCVCVCLQWRRLPSEVEGLHSFTGTGASKHLSKNARYDLISKLEVSRLFPWLMTPDTSFNNQAFTSWQWEYLHLSNVDKADLYERLPFLPKSRNRYI